MNSTSGRPKSANDALGLYVHIPWCVQKCPYCDFNSHVKSGCLPVRQYIDALHKDLESQLGAIAGRTVDTIFIGGGTPSLFSPQMIALLLRGIESRVEVSQNVEITMEANPGTVECGALPDYRLAGVNRLSLGVQSFNREMLSVLGRIHGPEEAKAALDQAKKAGFDEINIDLMFGLPGQTSRDAVQDLESAIKFQPTHVSYYQLTLEPNTLFYSRPPQLPDEEEMEAIQSAGDQLLVSAGYRRYEVSAYSKRGHQCRHNLNYWEFGDYIGLGAGAHGKIRDPDSRQHVRNWNFRSPEDYMAAAVHGRQVSGSTVVEQSELVLEFMMNALRLTEGVDAGFFSAATGVPIGDLLPLLRSSLEKELITFEANHIKPTALGLRFLDDLILEFKVN